MTQAADKLAIAELCHIFEIAFDDGDIDAHMDTWVEDLSFSSAFGDHDTREGYIGWVKGFYEQTQQAGGTRHLISNSVATIRGDRATHTAYLTVLNRKDGSVMGTARFDDELVRTDDGWRFAARALSVDENLKGE